MAFIPRAKLEGTEIGTTVELTRDVEVCAGIFQKGTLMKIVASTHRGFDLMDEYGNHLYDTAKSNFRRTAIDKFKYMKGDQ